MFEHRRQPVLPLSAFLRRQLAFGLLAFAAVVGSLAIGILGYHYLEGLAWVDALLNASMILGGQGPVSELHQGPAKIFASCYALYSGIVFLISVGLLVAPLVHRLMHHFQLEADEPSSADDA